MSTIKLQTSLLLYSLLIHSSTAACTGVISSFTGTCDAKSFSDNLVAGCTLAELGLTNETIAPLCEYEAPVQFVEINGYYQLDKRYFNGGGPLIDSAEPFSIKAGRILRFDDAFGSSTLIGWPEYKATLGYNNNEHGYSPNFDLQDSCDLNTVMCCYIDDVNDSGFEEGDSTTDVCRHDLGKSPTSNHIKDGYSIMPGSETSTHCVGFSWKEGEVSDFFKGNALYDVSLRTTANKGYYKSIPGAPLCGCIEQMPTVETADCRTATGGEVTYTFEYDAETGKITGSNSVEVTYADCDEDDLAAHFKAIYPENAAAIDDHFVGDDGCADDIEAYLNEEKFIIPQQHSSKYRAINEESGWKFVAGEGIRFLPPHYIKDVADEQFRSLISAGCTNADGSERYCIIRRFCDSCSSESHRDIYYKRVNPIPDAGSDEGQVYFLDLFLNNWFNSPANILNTDFELYSTYEDALAGTNKWSYCNYNDPGIGFPRDCGVSKKTHNQWNSYIRNGGAANHHGFYVELPAVNQTSTTAPTTSSPTKTPVTSSPLKSPTSSPSKSPIVTPKLSSLCSRTRKVKIELTSGQALNLLEVQVLSSGNDISMNKAASQSSTLQDNTSKFGASRAVDGLANTFSHTQAESDGSVWWEVDLGAEHQIDSVTIMNRWCRDISDPIGCLCRLSSAAVILIDEQDAVIATQSVGEDTCGQLELTFDFSCTN